MTAPESPQPCGSDSPSSGTPARDVTGTGGVSPRPRTVAARTSGSDPYALATTAVPEGGRYSAAVVVTLTFATAALSLSDLYLLLAFLGG